MTQDNIACRNLNNEYDKPNEIQKKPICPTPSRYINNNGGTVSVVGRHYELMWHRNLNQQGFFDKYMDDSPCMFIFFSISFFLFMLYILTFVTE
jgi:hypothetical protein